MNSALNQEKMVFLLELIYMWKDMVCNIKSDQRQPSREQSLSINLEKPLSLTSRGMVGEHLNIALVFTKKPLQIQTIHRMEINRNINFYLKVKKNLKWARNDQKNGCILELWLNWSLVENCLVQTCFIVNWGVETS